MGLLSSWKILFCLIFVDAVFHFQQFAAFASEERGLTQKEMYTNFMKVSEKFDNLNERIDKLEQMMHSINELGKRTQNISKIVEHLVEAKTNSDAVSKIGSQMTSVCESKVKAWTNKTSRQLKDHLEKMEHSIDNSIFQSELKFSSACDPNPCINGGRCELTSYHCVDCPYLASGRHCENLNCNKANRCWQYQNMMYIAIEESMTWAEAYNRCAGVGMSLAMPKNQDTTEFLISQLKTVFPTSIFFWFGLKNTASSIEYRWIDGSVLGLYTGGKADFKSHAGERWAILWLGGTYWWPRSYPEIGAHLHYMVCEKRIFTRF